MLQQHLSEPQWWIGAVLVLGFFLVMWRYAKRPRHAPLDWDYCYDFVCEPAGAANPELARSFAAMLEGAKHAMGETAGEAAGEDAYLLRLAVMNRGGLSIAAADHLRPLTVAFPAGARMIDARYVEHFGPAPDTPPAVSVHERGFDVAPFDLPVNCALVFQAIVIGAARPSVVDGGIEGQPAIGTLGP